MAIPIALAVASTAISFMGSMSAARAAKREAAMKARLLENQKKQEDMRKQLEKEFDDGW